MVETVYGLKSLGTITSKGFQSCNNLDLIAQFICSCCCDSSTTVGWKLFTSCSLSYFIKISSCDNDISGFCCHVCSNTKQSKKSLIAYVQAPAVQRADNFIQRVKRIGWSTFYLLDSAIHSLNNWEQTSRCFWNGQSKDQV